MEYQKQLLPGREMGHTLPRGTDILLKMTNLWLSKESGLKKGPNTLVLFKANLEWMKPPLMS